MKFIEDLKEKVFCRLKPSPIHGIGVFAIRPIPKGIDPMQGTRPFEFDNISTSAVRNSENIPASVKKLVEDFCPEEGQIYWVPPYSLNEIGISWYVNHSNYPNMEERDGDFFSMRDIAEGEELTVDYRTYGELNLLISMYLRFCTPSKSRSASGLELSWTIAPGFLAAHW
jgi:hypothetical protein